MIHEPRCFLRYADLLCELRGRDTFLGSRKEVDSHEPLLKRYFALTEYRTRLDSEILLALGTSVSLAACEAVYLAVATMRAVVAFGKADALEVFTACVLVLEVGEEVHECLELKLFHIPIL